MDLPNGLPSLDSPSGRVTVSSAAVLSAISNHQVDLPEPKHLRLNSFDIRFPKYTLGMDKKGAKPSAKSGSYTKRRILPKLNGEFEGGKRAVETLNS